MTLGVQLDFTVSILLYIWKLTVPLTSPSKRCDPVLMIRVSFRWRQNTIQLTQAQQILTVCSSPLPYEYHRYKNTWIFVERNREKQMVDLHTGTPWETVTLTAIGRNKELFYEILNQGNTLRPEYKDPVSSYFMIQKSSDYEQQMWGWDAT